MRRYVIAGIILAVLLIGAVAYFFFFDSNDQVLNSGLNPSSEVSDSTGAVAITKTPMFSAVLSLDETSIWYFGRDGQLYRNDLSGTGELNFNLNGADPAIGQAFWPATGNDFIVWAKAVEGSGSYWLYQATQQSFVVLPPNVKSPAWLPDGQRIVYVWQRGDGVFELKVAESTTRNYRTVRALDGPYSVTAAPDGGFALLIQSAAESETNKILLVNLSDGQTEVLLNEGKNLNALISPDSRKFLFTRLNPETKLSELQLYDFESKTFKNLQIFTAISKVVWASDSKAFYYGQPRSISASDPAISSITADDFFAYGLSDQSQKKIELNSGDKQFDIREPIVSAGDDLLFFRDGTDNSLYRVNLK